MMKWQGLYVVWVLLVGCSTTRGVRLETDDGRTLVITSGIEAVPVDLEEDAFAEALVAESSRSRPSRSPEEAARRLFEMDERGGVYRFDVRTRQVTPVGAGGHLEGDGADVEMTRAYLRWCERTGQSGDCLGLLVERSTVGGDGRYALAMALAHGAVLEEMWEAFEDMADPRAMVAAAMWTGTMYLVLWSVPEPVSKGLAAVMTATLIAYVGVDTFWSLMAGFQRLMEAVDKAHTFDELREAGESYGRVMGRNAARAFAMLATVAVGNTAAGFAGRVPTLPGSAQASVQASARAGIALSAVGEVQAVAMTSEVSRSR
ncbi:hypothetical protein [Myxococcus sp. AB025B]|uniref:SitA5 family polymorphic toxin n=1 Tax=Myxococcus TaxID=32 RepID=UPI001E4B0BFA|nr:hypothetical protein [Myxococcus sp. AB025B]